MSLDQLSPVGSDGQPDGGHRPPRRSRRRQALTVVAAVAGLALLLVVALQLTGGVRQAVSRIAEDTPVAPSEVTMLEDLWDSYTEEFLEDGSRRTIDPSNGTTTSEGQSYTMMRAVWMDDRATFEESWEWAKDNLQRPDRLLAWRFGERPDGSYGVLSDAGGQNAAADADVDVAFALLMAYSRWQDDDYLYDASPLIDAIWALEVVEVAGRPVLTANDLERNNPDSVLVNPSYFAPYAYRAFARVDPEHDWAAVVDSSYDLLEESSWGVLAGQVDADGGPGPTGAGLPPEWLRLDRTTGALSAATDVVPATGASTDFGFEGLRTPWRLALDQRWHGEERAAALLEQQAQVLGADWDATGSLAAVYSRDGSRAADYSTAALYGGTLAALEQARPELAEQVYRQELAPLYDADLRSAVAGTSYYDANWAWFGMALHLDRLPDLNATGSDLT